MNASMPSSRYVPAPWQQLRDEGRRLGTESSPRLRGDKDVLQSVKPRAGKWGQRGGANVFATTSSKAMMPKFYAGGSIKWSPSLFDLANQLARPDRDIYQFGVYTGTTLKLSVSRALAACGPLIPFRASPRRIRRAAPRGSKGGTRDATRHPMRWVST